jgi:hypothetical protein
MSAPLINPHIPHVALAQVFERVNRKGQRYLVGRIGIAKLLIVPSGEVSRGEPVWQVFLGEGAYTPEGLAGLAHAAEDAHA